MGGGTELWIHAKGAGWGWGVAWESSHSPDPTPAFLP